MPKPISSTPSNATKRVINNANTTTEAQKKAMQLYQQAKEAAPKVAPGRAHMQAQRTGPKVKDAFVDPKKTGPQ